MSSINAYPTFNYSQPREYRFSHDSVFLARKVFELERARVSNRTKVLDLCSGCGIVGLDFMFHCENELKIEFKTFDFLEIQEIYVEHFALNKDKVKSISPRFINASYEDLNQIDNYDLIISNPPYFDRNQGKIPPNEFKSRCRFFIDSTSEELWSSIYRNLKFGGRAYILVQHELTETIKRFENQADIAVVDKIRGTPLVCFQKKIPILYQDDDLVVANKPAGILVHRSMIAKDSEENALQIVRDQIKKYVYPVHRLDRPTSGPLIFALNKECATGLAQAFQQKQILKTYLAIVRGYSPQEETIDYPLNEELDPIADKKARPNKERQSAITYIRTLSKTEVNVCVDKFPTSRYSLVQAKPQTGRKHQIRRHLRHIGCPIIGDVTHGSGKHNRFFQERFKHKRLYLTCTNLSFKHPKTNEMINIVAPIPGDFMSTIGQLGFELPHDYL